MRVRTIASGPGWTASEFDCSCGPRDRPFEERHAGTSVALVLAGTFQYHSAHGRFLLTPGSLLLGNHGQSFECGHEHGVGDRCLSFTYEPEYFERVAFDTGARPEFASHRVPASREMSGFAVGVCAALPTVAWAEFAVSFAATALTLANDAPGGGGSLASEARVTRAIRRMESEPFERLSLDLLAEEAKLSPFHFLRTFQLVAGVTPHQYLLRMRLRAAAVRLAAGKDRILDVALDSGFGDVSNFNRAFRAEFGVNPRAYRVRRVAAVQFRV